VVQELLKEEKTLAQKDELLRQQADA